MEEGCNKGRKEGREEGQNVHIVQVLDVVAAKVEHSQERKLGEDGRWRRWQWRNLRRGVRVGLHLVAQQPVDATHRLADGVVGHAKRVQVWVDLWEQRRRWWCGHDLSAATAVRENEAVNPVGGEVQVGEKTLSRQPRDRRDVVVVQLQGGEEGRRGHTLARQIRQLVVPQVKLPKVPQIFKGGGHTASETAVPQAHRFQGS